MKYKLIRTKSKSNRAVEVIALVFVFMIIAVFIKDELPVAMERGWGYEIQTLMLIGFLLIMIVRDLFKKKIEEIVELKKVNGTG